MAKHRILIIDDEPDICASLERLLKDIKELIVFTALDTVEARNMLASKNIDLVICDYRMPGVNGIEFLEGLSKEKPGIVTILLTGDIETETAIQAINKTAISKFVVKPWDNNELKTMIQGVLKDRERDLLGVIKARDIMSKFAITAKEDMGLMNAAHLMMRFKVSGLPVLSNAGKLIGIITATDLFRVMGEGLKTSGPESCCETGSSMKIKSVMTCEVLTVTRETLFVDIIRLMFDKNIHTLPVVENGEIVGIIGRRDVLNTYYNLCDKA